MARPLKVMSNIAAFNLPLGTQLFPIDSWSMSADEQWISTMEGEESTTYPAMSVAILQIGDTAYSALPAAPVAEKVAGIEAVVPLKFGTLFETVNGPCYVPAVWMEGVSLKGAPEFKAAPTDDAAAAEAAAAEAAAAEAAAAEAEAAAAAAPKLTRRAARR